MNEAFQPKRCPRCHALVVDRRSPTCTTCQTQLPKEWVMTRDQVVKLREVDAASKKEHAESMQKWDQIKSSSDYPTP